MKSDCIQLGDVTFDPITGAITDKGGCAVNLRHKSKSVLGILLETPGETVRKTDIMDRVWADVTVSDESLAQCVADIRRIIGADARKIVETVPRAGYRVNVTAKSKRRSLWPVALGVASALCGLIAALWLIQPNKESPPPLQPQTAAHPPGTEVTQAYLEVLQGRVSANRFGFEESLTAERHFRRAIDLDPSYARAHAELAALLAVRFENDWSVMQKADEEKALFYAKKAVALDPELWLGHYALGRVHSVLAQYEEAAAHLEMALTLQPDNEDARAYYAVVKNFTGDFAAAVAILDPVLKTHPNPPYWYYFALGHALFNTQRFEDAARALETCLTLAANSPYCLRYLIATYGELGDLAKATAAADAYRSAGFEPSVQAILSLMTFHHPEGQGWLEAALRKAGLPEG